MEEAEYYEDYDNQQQQPIRTTPYASPMHQFGSAIITMTNPKDELHKMELTFRSVYEDSSGAMHTTGMPLMNDYGISSVIGMVQALVNQVTIMSNLTKQEIPMLVDFLGDTLARDLMIKRKEYGIAGSAERDKIYFSALSTTFVTLKRGFEEGDKRFWKGSVQEIHNKIENTNKKPGLMASLNPFRQ
jgi:hypothetical protein